MKLPLKDIIGMGYTLMAMREDDSFTLPAKSGFLLAYNFRLLIPIIQSYEEQAKSATTEKELNALLDTEVEINLQTIPLKAFEELSLPFKYINALYEMIGRD